MADNSINFEEYRLFLMKQYPVAYRHKAYMWLSALKIYANVKNHREEKRKSQWDKLLDEVKNKPIKSRKNK